MRDKRKLYATRWTSVLYDIVIFIIADFMLLLFYVFIERDTLLSEMKI